MTTQEFQEEVHDAIGKVIMTFGEKSGCNRLSEFEVLLVVGILEFEKSLILRTQQDIREKGNS